MTRPPSDLQPTHTPPVMGYAGRRVQLITRDVMPPRAGAPFLDAAHVLDHWATMPPDDDHPIAAGVFGGDREQLLKTVAGAREVWLSDGGGLLAYRCGSPQRWHVRHAESGVQVTRLTSRELRHRWWTRLSPDAGLQFAPGSAPAYVRALEGLVDPRGTQIDWTAPAQAVFEQLARWQDHDEYGALPEPGTDNRFGGMRGLHLAAILHAIATSRDPLRDAVHGTMGAAADTITGPYDRMASGGRNGRELVDYLQRLDRDYNHGRLRARRDRDWRTRQDLREDRITGRIVTLTRLRTVGGQPHRAFTLLRDRAHAIAHTDARRRDGLHTGKLLRAARMIADLFSPAVLPAELLYDIKAGQLIVEGDRRRSTGDPVEHAWRVTQPAHRESTGTGPRTFDLKVDQALDGRPGTLRVRPGTSDPLRIVYDDGSLTHSLPTLGGDWIVIEANHPGLPAHGDVLSRAELAANAFLQATPSSDSHTG